MCFFYRTERQAKRVDTRNLRPHHELRKTKGIALKAASILTAVSCLSSLSCSAVPFSPAVPVLKGTLPPFPPCSPFDFMWRRVVDGKEWVREGKDWAHDVYEAYEITTK